MEIETSERSEKESENEPKSEFTINDCTDYEDKTNFAEWMNHTCNTMEAHGLGEVSNPWYIRNPNDPQEMREFQKKQAKMFLVLCKKIKKMVGPKIVTKHVHTRDLQLILQELIDENYDFEKTSSTVLG
jgi:hypothetical protein